MKSTIKLLVLCIVVLTTLSPQAASASNSTVWMFRDKSVFASFSDIDESGCVYTDVFVYASTQMTHEPPGTGTWTPTVGITLQQDNICTHTIFNGYGSAPLDKAELQFQGNLDSATLTKTVSIINWWTGETAFDVDIDLTWTATSAIKSESIHREVRSENYHLTENVVRSVRFATASGTISNGTTNFTPQPAVEETNISFVKQGSISQGTE
jgi:hypothetical protein